MREDATTAAKPPPSAERRADGERVEQVGGPATEIARRQIRQQRGRRGEEMHAAGISPESQRLGRGHHREHDAGAEHGPDQDPRDGEPGMLDLLAQGRDLLKAGEGQEPKREPERDRRGAHARGGDEEIAHRRVALRPVPLRHDEQHRAGHQQHGRDGDAFEDDQDEAGAARGNDAQRADHHGGQRGQREARGVAPEVEPLQQVGAEQPDRRETDGREAEIGAEQRPAGDQPGAGTEHRPYEAVGRARIGMVMRQAREAPRHHQHDDGGEREDERHHPPNMLGRLLRIEVHGHRGRHARDRDGDGIPGADALEQDDVRIDRRALSHGAKLACPRLQVEHREPSDRRCRADDRCAGAVPKVGTGFPIRTCAKPKESRAHPDSTPVRMRSRRACPRTPPAPARECDSRRRARTARCARAGIA
jgi:hypothetical protein